MLELAMGRGFPAPPGPRPEQGWGRGKNSIPEQGWGRGQISPVSVPASPLCDIMSLALFYVFLNVIMFEQKLAMWEL